MDLRCDVREALVEWLRVQVPSRGHSTSASRTSHRD